MILLLHLVGATLRTVSEILQVFELMTPRLMLP